MVYLISESVQILIFHEQGLDRFYIPIYKHTDKQIQVNMHHSSAIEQHRQNALCLLPLNKHETRAARDRNPLTLAEPVVGFVIHVGTIS